MIKPLRDLKLSLAVFALSAMRVSVSLAVVASQLGERLLRGARGFARYRDSVLLNG